jgi:hypothetical protein
MGDTALTIIFCGTTIQTKNKNQIVAPDFFVLLILVANMLFAQPAVADVSGITGKWKDIPYATASQ